MELKFITKDQEVNIMKNFRYANDRLEDMLNDVRLKDNQACLSLPAIKFKLDKTFKIFMNLEVKKVNEKKKVKPIPVLNPDLNPDLKESEKKDA